MQTGDNMLAIYASEKALRLAERLGETRAASRAHGIFGRVFGRIGDTVKARENLERAVELARGSDQTETILALLALGQHLEVSEADYANAEGAYAEALALAEEIGDVPAQVELHAALAWLAAHRADWEAVRSSHRRQRPAQRAAGPGQQALPGPRAARAAPLARRRLGRRRGPLPPRARAGRAGRLVRGGVLGAVRPGHACWRTAVTSPAPARLLGQALDICERAGLIAQSIQAIAARAEVLALAGKDEQAPRPPRRPPSWPSGCTTRSAARPRSRPRASPPRPDQLAAAREAWLEIGRPLDAARCGLLAGRLLRGDRPRPSHHSGSSRRRVRAAGRAAAVAAGSRTARHLWTNQARSALNPFASNSRACFAGFGECNSTTPTWSPPGARCR